MLFDCFGDFEGFVLDTCSGSTRFLAREKGIGEIILRACRERLAVSVFVERGPARRIHKLAIRC